MVCRRSFDPLTCRLVLAEARTVQQGAKYVRPGLSHVAHIGLHHHLLPVSQTSHTVLILLQAALDLGTDLHRLTTSLFSETGKGAQKDGAVGAVKGLGKGIIGTVGAAAAVGLDLTTNVTSALGALGKVGQKTHSEPERLRLPRTIHHGGVVEEFHAERAHGQAILRKVCHEAAQAKWGNELQKAKELATLDISQMVSGSGADAREIGEHELYNDHHEVGEGQWLVLSDGHLLLVTGSDKLFSKKINLHLSWCEQLEDIEMLDAANNVLSIHLSHQSQGVDNRHTVEMRTPKDAAHMKQLLHEAMDVSPLEPWILPIVDGHLQPEGDYGYEHEEQAEVPDDLLLEPEPGPEPEQLSSTKKKGVGPGRKKGSCGCCGAPDKEEEADRARRKRNAA